MGIIEKINDAFHEIMSMGEKPEGVILSKEQVKELDDFMKSGYVVNAVMPANLNTMKFNGVDLEVIIIPEEMEKEAKPCIFVSAVYETGLPFPKKEAVVVYLN